MVLELADVRIRPGCQPGLESAVRRGVEDGIARVAGFRGRRIERGLESPERSLPLIEWDTLESHTVGFGASPAFAREIVGRVCAAPPRVEHVRRRAPPAQA